MASEGLSLSFAQQVCTDFKNITSHFGWGREGLSPLSCWSKCGDKPSLPQPKLEHRVLKSAILISNLHWLQNPMFQLWLGEGGLVSTFWSATYADFKTLCSNFGWGREGLSPHFDQQLTLTSKPYVPTLAGGGRACLHILVNKWHWLLKPKFQFWLGEAGDVSTFWSATDTDFKNITSNFGQWGVVPTFHSGSDTDFKNITSHFAWGREGLSPLSCWSKCGDKPSLPHAKWEVMFLKSVSLAEQKVETTPHWPKLELRF